MKISVLKYVFVISILSMSVHISSVALANSSKSDIEKQAQRHYELGKKYKENKEYDKAIAELRQAVQLAPKNDSAVGNLGWFLLLNGNHEESKQASEHALLLAPDEYFWSVNLGHAYLMLGYTKKARNQYEYTLPLIPNQKAFDTGPKADFELFIKEGWQVEASRRELAWMTEKFKPYLMIKKRFKEVYSLYKKGKAEQAIKLYRQQLDLYRLLVDENKLDLAKQINSLALWFYKVGRYAEAEPLFREALSLRKKSLPTGHRDIATSLNNLALLLATTGRYTEAEPLYREALSLYKKVLPVGHPRIAASLNNLASLLETTGRYVDAEPLYRKALSLHKKALSVGHPDIALSFNNLAGLLTAMGRYAEAESLHREALSLRKKALPAGHPDIATSLNNLAVLLETTGQYAEAEPLYREALSLHKKALPAGHPDIATSLNNLAVLLETTGHYAEAEPLYREALSLRKKALPAGHPDIATSINNLASLLATTGRYADAEPLYRKALSLRKKALPAGHPDIALSINNLANLLETTGHYAEAEPLYREALSLRKKALPEGHSDIATSINNLALLLYITGRYADAEPLYREALSIHKKALPAGHHDIALSLNNLAGLLEATGRYAKAEPLYREAYLIAIKAGDPRLKWLILGNLMYSHQQQAQHALAIFYGKQAINTIQQTRQMNTGLDAGARQSFLKTVVGYYKNLADVLIEQGRLSEAQQVLAMLKEQEYSEFLRRSATVDPRTTQISFTKTEQVWVNRYDDVSRRLHTIAPELRALRKKKKQGGLSAKEQQRITQLKKDRTFATQQFKHYLDELKATFSKLGADRQNEFSKKNLASLTAMQSTLAELGPGTLLIHYLLTKEKMHILLTSENVLLHREVKIKETALNDLIFDYRTTLQNPNLNPLVLAKQLYDYLIKPIEQDLKNLKAKVLMVSLDGSLRYLPLSALHDGKQWLVERYGVVMFTEAAKATLTAKRQGRWKVAGLGVSEGGLGLSPLLSVKQELDEIVKSGDKDRKGVLPGVVRLDKDFTAEEFSALLDDEEAYQVIHLASHFVLKPGTEIESYLLLGNNQILTLAEFNNGNYPLNKVDMLTLSACNTALGGSNANGREVEGFGALAQRLGAKSVLATLWSVEDASTGQFMQRMYALREANNLTKIEAIRRSQLAMINGQMKPARDLLASRGKKTAPRMWLGEGYSHPYFWAPFILMGNWL